MLCTYFYINLYSPATVVATGRKATHKYKRKMTTGRKQQNTSTGCRFYIYTINRPTDLVIETEDFTQIVRPFHRRTGDVLVNQLDQCV